MSKSLHAIQVLAKIGKILSNIIFICCIVSASLCIVGVITLAIGAENALRLGGVSIHSIIVNEAGMTMDGMIAALVMGLIFSVGEAVLAKFAQVYFKHELVAGTPFTFDGAKEIMRLGILAIVLPIGTKIISAIVDGILKVLLSGTWNIDINNEGGIAMGVMFIVASVIFKYGAELMEQKKLEKGKE